jgi:hypothetical protein
MLYVPILAQAAGRQEAQVGPVANILEGCWTHVTGLSWAEAVVAIAFGLILLAHGWRIHKMLVVISFGLIGMLLGILIGARVGSQLWGAIAGMAVLAFVSVPLMQWGISLLGAIAGGILAAGLWHAVNLPEKYILAGALVGIVAGGMISFIVVKAAVMLFTSFEGAVLIVLGALSLLGRYPQTSDRTEEMYFEQKWVFPLLLILVTAIGIYVQAKFNKGGDGGKK